jgi:hypothetical protein
MNAIQVSVVGILIGLVAVAAALSDITAYAFESQHDSPVISGAGQYEKAIQRSGIQLAARFKAGHALLDGGGSATGSVSSSTESKSKTVRQQTPYGQRYNVCMAQCRTTPVPVPTTNCASKCSQQCRPQAK